MEYRTINQIKLYVLVLNTFGEAESGSIAAVSTDYDALVKKYNEDLLPSDERFRDGAGFLHSFREGSPFFNLNPCWSLEVDKVDCFGHGIHTEWVNEENIARIQNEYYFIY